GGSAVGGVVNAIDNRIPRDKIDSTSGAIEALLGGGATERGLSALVETGGAGFALHADAFKRRTDDLRVPAFDRPLDDGTTARRTRIVNSDSNADGGALGGSMVWDHGYLGASLDTYRNAYGTVAEEDVKIHMRRNKLALAGEVRDLGGVISTVRGQLGATDYEHQEVQGDGTVGTTFKNKGTDLRLETVHRPMSMGDGKLDGAFGLQGEQSRFNALGEEAFVPTTHTRQLAGFVYEQWTHGTQGHLSAGLRAERVHVDSDGDTEFSDGRFGPPQRSGFTPRSGSIGGLLNLSKEWQLTTHWAYTERAPVSYELYANGVHAATGTFERGDRAQRKERGQNVDISLQWKRDTDSIKLGAFTSRFSNYIALMRSGDPDFVDASGASFPVYEFRGVKARLQGFEIEGHWRVFSGRRHVDLDGHVDLVRGDNRSSGEPLPRIAPVRTTLGVNWESGPWTSRAEVVHAAKQSRVPSDDMPTPGWTLVNLSTAYNFNWSQNDVLLFVKLGNVGNRLAYNAASIATVRALAPLPGRSLMAGVRVSF
ncbi:MAG TPA: TonB-dependent receptor, partial [Burkholderiaceae bacterium]|nr:TonB-dependent receptor [Burkholderiaceae bacterium]